ncbi:POT family proton-dependent oligopeptide transporter [Sphingomonas sp. SORGH_AS802]|uniref:peptide MFS transporter n=1 Tax=unclassified Sphingomonas TaxID=196159 RepID=UPI002864EC20|nr:MULTISPECIES: peptide MFS transporter [unclassified Sphingomonas]MDR6128099.1 POT family proton-dependent oligopeptide transporter [Sphingomonas sp. SORGH_AS_0438]MDR6135695.1 POT family proton-dependent oligopeptide transporter [Sphingomonas sp. SORGH_AS_0802]
MVDTPTADTPREPDITHVNPAAQESWFGHPRQLARLFTTEMWERFGFYGMRALLTLYLTKHFVFGDREATGLYGGYTALVYLTPLVGGWLADQYLGFKRAVKFGAILMSIGYFILCFGGESAKPIATIDGQRYAVQVDQSASGGETQYLIDNGQRLKIQGQEDGSAALVAADGRVTRTVAPGKLVAGGERSDLYVTIMLLGLCLVSVGNGFFKPNISTMVGELYAQGDRRRDAGFTIFYMGINLGSFLSQLLCPFLADAIGWWAGFGLAAAGMVFSWALIQFDGGKLSGYGEPPLAVRQGGKDRALGIYALALLGVPVFYLLFINLMNATPPVPGSGIMGYIASLSLMGKLLFGTFLIGVPAILIWSAMKGDRREFQMMLAAMVMIVFNVVFWTLFEQAGSSLTLFADRNTDLSVFGLFSISAGQTQFFNALFIILLAPVMSALWTGLARRGLEPSVPVKFAIALVGVGAGFLFLVWGATMVGPTFKVAIWWLAGLYFIHSFAELCISPVGLSMITKLSIARIVGMMMGVWFLSISVAQYVAGIVAQVASVETVGGQVTNLKVSLDTYTGVFWTIGWIAVGIGLFLLLLSPLIKRWMHGVK